MVPFRKQMIGLEQIQNVANMEEEQVLPQKSRRCIRREGPLNEYKVFSDSEDEEHYYQIQNVRLDPTTNGQNSNEIHNFDLILPMLQSVDLNRFSKSVVNELVKFSKRVLKYSNDSGRQSEFVSSSQSESHHSEGTDFCVINPSNNAENDIHQNQVLDDVFKKPFPVPIIDSEEDFVLQLDEDIDDNNLFDQDPSCSIAQSVKMKNQNGQSNQDLKAQIVTNKSTYTQKHNTVEDIEEYNRNPNNRSKVLSKKQSCSNKKLDTVKHSGESEVPEVFSNNERSVQGNERYKCGTRNSNSRSQSHTSVVVKIKNNEHSENRDDQQSLNKQGLSVSNKIKFNQISAIKNQCNEFAEFENELSNEGEINKQTPIKIIAIDIINENNINKQNKTKKEVTNKSKCKIKVPTVEEHTNKSVKEFSEEGENKKKFVQTNVANKTESVQSAVEIHASNEENINQNKNKARKTAPNRKRSKSKQQSNVIKKQGSQNSEESEDKKAGVQTNVANKTKSVLKHENVCRNMTRKTRSNKNAKQSVVIENQGNEISKFEEVFSEESEVRKSDVQNIVPNKQQTIVQVHTINEDINLESQNKTKKRVPNKMKTMSTQKLTTTKRQGDINLELEEIQVQNKIQGYENTNLISQRPPSVSVETQTYNKDFLLENKEHQQEIGVQTSEPKKRLVKKETTKRTVIEQLEDENITLQIQNKRRKITASKTISNQKYVGQGYEEVISVKVPTKQKSEQFATKPAMLERNTFMNSQNRLFHKKQSSVDSAIGSYEEESLVNDIKNKEVTLKPTLIGKEATETPVAETEVSTNRRLRNKNCDYSKFFLYDKIKIKRRQPKTSNQAHDNKTRSDGSVMAQDGSENIVNAANKTLNLKIRQSSFQNPNKTRRLYSPSSWLHSPEFQQSLNY